MNKIQKNETIQVLKKHFSEYTHFYVTNTESLTVEQINKLRKSCFEKKIVLKVAKNTLVKKALSEIDDSKYSGVYESLHGVTALMFTNNPKDPAVIVSSFRVDNPKAKEKPTLKLAYIAGELFIGDNQLDALKNLKTKDELIGEIIGLLQSPLRNILSGLTREDRKGKAGEESVEVVASSETTPTTAE